MRAVIAFIGASVALAAWAVIVCVTVIAIGIERAPAHDIYTGQYGKDGQLCCGEDDCFRTTWREHGDQFDFWLAAERRWITLPVARITFLPIPGDDHVEDGKNYGHICYRPASPFDRSPLGYFRNRIIDGFVIWCAFIPPGGS